MRMVDRLNEKVFTFHSDPGHGWLEVTLLDLSDLGLSLSDDVSPYSFFEGNKVYLEEDMDCGVFSEALVSY